MRAVTKFILAAPLAALLAGSPARAAGTLTIAQAQDPANWDPIATFLISWGSVASNFFEGLVSRDENLKLQPGLATSWEVLDNGLRLRFHLRDGVTFSDGEPFNADVVKFTMERLLGPEGKKGPQQSNYTAIKTITVIDPLTVDLIMDQPDPVMITKLAGYGAMMVPPKYVTEKGAAGFAAMPVGTGPFKVVDYQPKVSVTLEPNPTYWGEKAKLDRVIYKFIVEPDTQLAELQAGRLDIASNLSVAATGIVAKDPKLVLDSITGPTVLMLRFDTAHGPTADERVRHAMIMAVDRDTIVKQILQGQAKPVVSFQSDLSFGFDPAQKPVPFDPAGAKKLLAEAGVKPGTAMALDFPSNNSTFREAAQAVAGYLGAVGIKLQVRPQEQNVYTNDIIPNGKTGALWEFGWGGWTFDYDNTAYLLYHSGQHWNPYDKDPTLDAMLEAQRLVPDRGEREKKLQAIAHYVADHALELPMYNLNTIYGLSKRVKGFVPPPDNRVRLFNVTVE
jgi:peptide/nickel transport system substrate-binding protein